jgi:F-type H+-transporting ATPase subunit delta
VLSAPGPPGEERAKDDERVDVSETASISASIAERYAQALFELAREGDDLASLEADADALAAALDASEDLRKVIASPRVTRDEMTAAVAALAEPLGLSRMTANALGLMAEKRRLFTLPQFVAKLRGMIAAEKGEVEAQVTSAVALTDEQKTRIADLLRVRFGRNIKLNTSVDESLIGGLIVKVGSKMIDTSIRAKLANLQNAMKEVG